MKSSFQNFDPRSDMSQVFNTKPNRRLAPLLATAGVIFLGAVGSAFIVAAAGSDPMLALVIFGIGIGIAICCVVLLRGVSEIPISARYAWVFSRESRPDPPYTPKLKTVKQRYGEKEPPTLEELRDMEDGTRNWVPSNTRRYKGK